MGPTEPRLLLIETSGRAGWVAVAHGPQLLAIRRLDQARRNARDLAPATSELLNKVGWQPRQVEAVLVGRGPGSYTGLRVGLISAKAFAWAARCSVLGIDTFAAIAAQAPPEALIVDVLADAQQERVYLQRFSRLDSATNFQPTTPLRIVPFLEWSRATETGGWATGPVFRTPTRQPPTHVQVAPEADWWPHPESVLRLGLERWHRGDRDDLWSLEPLYLRPSSAELQWDVKPRPGS